MAAELTIVRALNALAEPETLHDFQRGYFTGILLAYGISAKAIPNAVTGELQPDETMKAEKTINRGFRNRGVLSLAEENTEPSQQQL